MTAPTSPGSNGAPVSVPAALAAAGVTPALPSRAGAAKQSLREEKLDAPALRAWMLRNADPERKLRRCVLFTLAHKGEKNVTGVTEGDVKTRLGDTDRAQRIDEIVADFDRASREWVKSGCRGAQTFIVGGHRNENPETDAHVTFPFAVTPPPEASQNFEGSEKPDAVGALSQAMRILDTVLRIKSQDDQADKARLVELHRIDREHLERMHETRERYTAERETLADGAALRAAQLKKTELEIELEHALVMKLMAVGMPLLAQALGQDPAAVSEDVTTAFVLSLEPERIANLVKNLSPEQKKLADPVLAGLMPKLPDRTKMRFAELMMASEPEVKVTEVKVSAASRGGEGSK